MEWMVLNSTLDKLTSRALCALPFLPAALFALFPKWLLLRDHGFLVAARSAGYVVPNDRWEESLGWVDRIGFFRYDLLLNFILLPAIVVALAGVLRPRWRAPFVGLASVAVILVVFADMLSFSNVGRYLTPSMALDAVRWGMANPQYVFAYVSLSSLAKLLAILLLVLLLTVLAHRFQRSRDRLPGRTPATIAILLLPIITACTGAYSDLPDTSLHRPVLEQMAASLVRQSGSDAYDHLSSEQLRALFYQATGTEPSAPDRNYAGKARDHDLLVFVFETGPNRALDLTGDLRDFPTLRRLRRQALIGTAHHSTYPYTSRAIYSILSGTYPIDALDNYFYAEHTASIPGWPRALLADGYHTASYAPGQSQFTPDATMLQALGISQVRLSHGDVLRAGGPWEETLARDRETLAMLLGDMERWLAADRRFAAVFMPQAGHGPWHDLHGAGPDYPARGRALMALQDQWLGEIVERLQRHGRLHKTVILVTADHGVRTRSEDPAFTGGTIDDYSFHVPLLLWSPAAFPKGRKIGAISSHIDLAPTLLDLLGSRADRTFFQGLPLWDPHLAKRETYFFGRGYLGADGMHRDGRFLMTNYLFHSAYAATHLRFAEDDLLPAQSSEAQHLFAELTEMEAIRTSWLHRALVARPGAIASARH